MKTEILVEMATLKIYRICPKENQDIADEYFKGLEVEIENLKKSNSSFTCDVINSNSNKYEKVIVFLK